jgi:hypothetical protein
MFKVLEIAGSAAAVEIGKGFATHAEAAAAVRRHLKGFKASGHNPDKNYWWARNAEGICKCRISETE